MICVSCQQGKSCKLPFGESNTISKFPLHKIHCDLWGLAPLVRLKIFNIMLFLLMIILVFYGCFPWKENLIFFTCFLEFQRQVENQFDKRIKIFQCDGGGEFTASPFITHFEQCGIVKQTSCPGTPEQNEVIEW